MLDNATHITIIGMGRLMEALRPCYAALFGTDARLRAQTRAVTMDARDLEAKNERLGFTVTLGDNEAALRENKPGLVLFAPPPEYAPKLARDVLLPYIATLRESGSELPKIFAFPPSPDANFYSETLGEDVYIANCVPCLGGDNGGSVLVTYPECGRWNDEEMREVERFFSPIAKTVTLTPKALYDLLGSMCLYPLIYSVLYDVLKGIDLSLSSAEPSSLFPHIVSRFENGRAQSGAGDTYSMLASAAFAWARGIYEYQSGAGLDCTKDSVNNELMGYLRAGCGMTTDALEAQHRGFATPGGIAELLVMEYMKSTRDALTHQDKLMASGGLYAYIESEAIRLSHCASKKAASVHIPLIREGDKLTPNEIACFLDALPQDAADTVRSHAPLDESDIYSLSYEALSSYGDRDALIWEALMELGARFSQSAAYLALRGGK